MPLWDLADLKAKLRGALLSLAIWGTVVGIVAGGFLVLAVFLYTNQPPDREALWSRERTGSYTVVDPQGQVLAIRGDFHGVNRKIEDLPRHLVTAFLAIEDQRFYHHSGVDFWSLFRAFLANIHAGRTVQGGSTITQQVAKNVFLTPDRTMARKLSEVVHAIWLERHLSKNEILELYLNQIYLGAGTYGVDAAARFYFGKEVTEVSLAEAAMLAGLPKAPSRFAPTTDLRRAQHRASLVLNNMQRFGFITKDQEAFARLHPGTPIARPGTDGMAHFVDAAIQEADRLIGRPDQDVVLHTTIDLRLQTLAEQAVTSVLDEMGEEANAGEAALVAFDRSGGVTAMVGGRDYLKSQFNRATQAERQPGSAFKPFVYVAALENGVHPTDPVFDEPVRVGDWVPANYGGAYRGRISVRQALALSSNSVAVYLSETVGREKVIEAAHRLGVERELESHRSIALGTPELTLMELSAAYMPFALNGLRVEPHIVTKITTRDGNPVHIRADTRPVRVLDKGIARSMTHMLYQVIHAGTGTRARIEGHPAAGKTGTSQNFRDGWFVGYTGHRLAGVWVGNDDSSPTNDVSGATLPAEIWRRFMAPAHAGERAVDLPGGFPAPPDRFGREELVAYLRSLKRDLDRVRDDRGGGIFARSDNWDADRYDWQTARQREEREEERRRRRWWPF